MAVCDGDEPGQLTWEDLPENVLFDILAKLDAAQLSQARLACKRLAAFGKRPDLPPRQEQLQLQLHMKLCDKRNTFTRVADSSRVYNIKEAIMWRPGSLGTLRQMAALQLSAPWEAICTQEKATVLEPLGAALAGSMALRDLRVHGMAITDEAAEAWCRSGALRRLERLELLTFGSHMEGPSGQWRMLQAAALGKFGNLRMVALSFAVNITPPPAGAAASMLAAMPNLETLSVDLDYVHDPWAADFAEGVLVASRQLRALTSFQLKTPSLGRARVRAALTALTSSATRLTHLGVPGLKLGDVGAAALARAPAMASLTSLDLERNELTLEGVAALVMGSAPGWRLRALSLAGNNFEWLGRGAGRQRAIPAAVTRAAPPVRLTVESLDLSNCILDGPMGAQMGRWIDLTRLQRLALNSVSMSLCNERLCSGVACFLLRASALTSLDLRMVKFREPLIDRLLWEGISGLRGLTSLALRSLSFGPVSVARLARLPLLASLIVEHCHVGDRGAFALASCTSCSSLRRLEIEEVPVLCHPRVSRGTRISSVGVNALAKSPWLRGLQVLRLSSANVQDAGVASLAFSEHMGGLSSLDIGGCTITDVGAEVLSQSPYLRGLVRLDLRHSGVSNVGAHFLALSKTLVSLKEVHY